MANADLARQVFHDINPAAGETIQQFATRLKKAALYCAYGDETDNNIRDANEGTCVGGESFFCGFRQFTDHIDKHYRLIWNLKSQNTKPDGYAHKQTKQTLPDIFLSTLSSQFSRWQTRVNDWASRRNAGEYFVLLLFTMNIL